MERAAAALAQVVSDMIASERVVPADASSRPASRVLVLAGSGNNGGDALFAAATLAERVDIDVLAVSDRVHAEGLHVALAAGAKRVDLAEASSQQYAFLVDGLVGIGSATNSALRGEARQAVETLLPHVQNHVTRVVAVDLPSGLHPDTGAADEAVLPADVTVTFGGVKHGLTVRRGPELCGEVILVRIGIDDELAREPSAGHAHVRCFHA
ncbi:MAG: NAD(P)H-hydrate epimerase [Leucobacter sp.]